MIYLVKNYSICARRMKKSVIRELLKLTNKPGLISFAGGLPDPALFPVEEIKEITHYVLEKKSISALQYGTTEGDPELIEELIKLAKEEDEHITEKNILVTTASQQGLDIIGKIFIDPSDPIVVELPSYLGALQAFNCYGAVMYGVETDDEGILLEKLEDTLSKLKETEEHYKFLYLVPDFQNPSGVTLSKERRKKVVDIADRYNIFIVEDTPYRQVRFEGEHQRTLFSMCSKKNVIELNTFSKIFVPGIRLGWIKAREDVISKFVVAKQSMDLCTPNITQKIAAEFCKRGYLNPHLEKVKKIYKSKKDAMLNALNEYMPDDGSVSWTRPEGGLFLWIKLPEFINADDMFHEAIKENVAYVIGSAFHCDGSGQNTMRLNFSYPTENEIQEGIKRLAKCIKSYMAKEKTAVK